MAFKAIFLDRDNTIIDDPGYINNPNQVELLPGAGDALSDMRNMGYKLIIISNQSGVARGIVTEETLSEIHQRLLELLRKEGVVIDGIYYCPYHPDGVIEKYRKESSLRKPAPGMIFLAAEEMDIDLKYSWMIGDSYRDVEAGRLAGCRTILINSPSNPTVKEYSDPEPDSVAVNIKEAANIIKMCVRDGKLPFKVAEKRKVPNAPAPKTKEDIEEITEGLSDSHTEEEMNRQQQPQMEYQDNQHQDEYPQDEHHEDHDGYHEHEYAHEDIDKNFEGLTPEQQNTHLLKQIASGLRKDKEEDFYEDFSMMKVFAGIVQISVIACLMISVWFLLDQTRPVTSVHTMIGYAIVLQLMAIAFYIYMMDSRK